MFGERLGRRMWRGNKRLAGGILEAKRGVERLVILLSIPELASETPVGSVGMYTRELKES